MSTPKKKRRYEFALFFPDRKGGAYTAALNNPDYALALAAIVSEFEHLELNMGIVLGSLLGLDDEAPAGYILRALTNTKARIDIMKALLEKAAINQKTGDKYDEILDEFDQIRALRNGYVHGIWATADTGEVYWARRSEHGFWFADGQEEPLQNLLDVGVRIRKLNIRVLTDVKKDILVRRQQRPGYPQQPPAPNPDVIASRSRRPSSEPKSDRPLTRVVPGSRELKNALKQKLEKKKS